MAVTALTRDRAGPIGVVPSDTGLAFVETSTGRISLTLHRDLEGAAALWKEFETRVPVTHAQSYESARAWREAISGMQGREVAIFAGRTRKGRLLFIWPLEIVRCRGLKAFQWIGQEMANYNMGLYDKDFAGDATGADIAAMLQAAANMAGHVSLARFRNQPGEWEGTPNPLSRLTHQESPNSGYAILLDHDFETTYRNRFGGRARNSLRRKERKLREMGAIEYGWAKTREQRRAVLAEFFRQKAAWFRSNGIDDLFDEPQHRAFYEALTDLPEGAKGRLELGYLKAGDDIVATFIGSPIDSRFHMLLSSITDGEASRWSPGILLMREQISEVSKKGYMRYDLGSGQAQHKSEWCDEEIPLFDSYIALDEMGYALTIPMSITSRAKRTIKNSPALWSVVRFLRRGRAKGAQEPAATAT
jgi:CelD/BcsL family acetyltransferase involved in cellulose biosynthesis